MKIIFLSFFGILLFKEFFILNYEIVIIIGFLLVLYFLLQNLIPLFHNFFINAKTSVTVEILNKLQQKLNYINLAIENKKTIIFF